LPPQLAKLHNMFHMSQLRKYVLDVYHVLKVVNVQIRDDSSLEAKSVRILNFHIKQHRGKNI